METCFQKQFKLAVFRVTDRLDDQNPLWFISVASGLKKPLLQGKGGIEMLNI